MNKQKLLKICQPYRLMHNLQSVLQWEKVIIFDLKKNCFVLNHDKSFQIYFFCVKRQVKEKKKKKINK